MPKEVEVLIPSDAQYALEEALREVTRLTEAIRAHRDSWLGGDNACWQDNEKLYQQLPEGFAIPERGTFVELKNCERYLASCHHPGIKYVSPQVRIEELEAKVAKLEMQVLWVGDSLAR